MQPIVPLVLCLPLGMQGPVDLDRVSSSPIPPGAGQPSVLAPGDPPLTREVVERFNLFFEWLLEVPTTRAQRDEIQNYLVNTWKGGGRDGIEGAMMAVQMQKRLDPMSDADREYVRQKVRAKYLEGLRRTPDDLSARWALALYDSAHKPLVAGTPPLTRQICDAYAETLYFMHKEVTGETITLNKKALELFARQMIPVYQKSNEARRKHFADMPEMWAWIRSVWPRLDETQREKYRQEWRTYLKGMAPELTRPCLVQKTSPGSGGLPGSHSDYMFVSNLSMMSHYSTMNAISNLSSGWHYEYRYR